MGACHLHLPPTLQCVSLALAMSHRAVFFRLMTLPACIVWGVLEFLALQRSRLQRRRAHFQNLDLQPDSGRFSV